MKNSRIVQWAYRTRTGRGVLKLVQGLHLDRIAVWFLCSPLSRPVIPWYIAQNEIPMEEFQEVSYRSFREFFLQEKKVYCYDQAPSHLISPCDGWLSAYPIEEGQCFHIKGSCYQIRDLIQDQSAAQQFFGGQCLIFRLCASDYHHYCFIDRGTLERTQYIEGTLHSVQPIACTEFPVYSLNRRVWSLLSTEHFGPVIQVEVGALVVGGIENRQLTGPFQRGEKKGHFELSGSTIMLFLQRDAVQLNPEIQAALASDPEAEVRVRLGMCIAARTSPRKCTAIHKSRICERKPSPS